ncbi:type VI secretion system tip protein VgrG [Escherichia coli]|nr:type VI secretion system tip protein VgrG [Escherichia coli]MEA0088655.1 type VI secretion system tip protein VgrG [Escherichia coli]
MSWVFRISHKLKIRGLQSPVDVLTFEGREQLSTPFRYDIQFTSSDKAITPESVLMQDGAFSLTAPPVQGMPVQAPLRTLYGVITGFKHLSSSQDEARYEVRLEPRMALLARSCQNAIYQNQTVPQIVEKILRERHQMRGQDFVFNLKSEYPSREQVMQYGEDDLTASAARDRSYELTFTAIPYSERYGYRPALIPRPVMAGTLPARVTSTVKNDIYAHIDKDGRYRVNLDFDRDTWKPGYESLWVRQSRPYAGDTYGLHLPLLAGTEVSIAFEEGNPDRPYIAGVKHDSAHTDHVTIQNYKRNVLRTPANNKIRLDDERGKEHIKVSTEYGGKSQLNLGHLVDAGKQQRGEGFELRTDMWGAVRAKKGIFISADAQDKAQGQVREMAPAMAILDGAQSQMQSLSTDAQTTNADPADLSSQIALLQQSVKDLTQAVILLSAPKGVAIASGEHLQLAASKNVIANAGNNADIGVVKNMFIGVGQALSVFVRKAGIKLFANKGAVSVQAQNDLMELLAQKSIEITSTEDEIKITAKKKITLNGGGSYIRLDACGIEAGTPGEYNVKAGYYGRKPKAKLTPELMAFPVIKSEDFNQSFILLDENTGQPLINWPYELELESGLKMSGITDENGNTELISSDKEEVVNISVFEPDEFLDDDIN